MKLKTFFMGLVVFYVGLTVSPSDTWSKSIAHVIKNRAIIKENIGTLSDTEYFLSALYFDAGAQVIAMSNSNVKKPYVDLKIIEPLNSFQDRPLRGHKSVSTVQMVKYAEKKRQTTFYLLSSDFSQSVFFDAAIMLKRQPNIVRLWIKYPSKMQAIKKLAKYTNNSVMIVLLYYPSDNRFKSKK